MRCTWLRQSWLARLQTGSSADVVSAQEPVWRHPDFIQSRPSFTHHQLWLDHCYALVDDTHETRVWCFTKSIGLITQVFRQNLKPRLDKFSLYCFQIGIDHSFFYHSSSAIAIFHTTFQELFNRVIYFRLLKQKYAAIRAQTWIIEKNPSIFFSFNRISQLFTNRFG